MIYASQSPSQFSYRSREGLNHAVFIPSLWCVVQDTNMYKHFEYKDYSRLSNRMVGRDVAVLQSLFLFLFCYL